jgi:polyphosphate kinase 2 (PPK2 family)
VLKFFLNVSKKEQKKRFLERLEHEDKNWKFSTADLKERGFWDDYQKAFEDALQHTSTAWAPWYVIPADHKWVTRALVGGIVTSAIRGLRLRGRRSAPSSGACSRRRSGSSPQAASAPRTGRLARLQ